MIQFKERTKAILPDAGIIKSIDYVVALAARESRAVCPQSERTKQTDLKENCLSFFLYSPASTHLLQPDDEQFKTLSRVFTLQKGSQHLEPQESNKSRVLWPLSAQVFTLNLDGVKLESAYRENGLFPNSDDGADALMFLITRGSLGFWFPSVFFFFVFPFFLSNRYNGRNVLL